MEWVCAEQGVLCKAYTRLAFTSTKRTYYVGYTEVTRRLPLGARQPPDSFDSHRIPLHHPEEDINDTNHYSAYQLCYDQDASDETNRCGRVIQPQPEIGQIHPEVKDSRRTPYNLLIIGELQKEADSDKNQYLVAHLWMQEIRKPTAEEEHQFEEKRARAPKYPMLASPGQPCEAEVCDARCIRAVPVSYYNLRYRFIEKGHNVSFEATPETTAMIKSIQTQTSLWKD